MRKNLFTPTSVEETVIELDAFRNDVIGAAAFSFGLTALQFSPTQASAIASAALAFLLLWAIVRISPKSTEHKRHYQNMSFWGGNLRAVRANLVFFAGILFLGFIASGLLTVEQLAKFSLSKLLGA